MKENYSAWEIDFNDFEKCFSDEEKLKFLIRFAILAPSSHNSQPWAFKVEGKKIYLFAEDSRRLRASDPTDRQLFVSLGAALKNLLVAADYFGFKPSVKYFPSKNNPDLAAEITFTEEKKKAIPNKDHLIFSIMRRVNNRNKYESDLPATSFLEYLGNLSSKELEVSFISDYHKREKVVDALMAGINEAMASQAFRDELSEYVISNISGKSIGMPGFGMGMPLPVSLIAGKMLKIFGMPEPIKKQDEKLLKEHTPTFVIISTKNDDKLAWLKAGETFEEIALEAEKNNLKVAVHAAAVEIGEHYKILQTSFGTALRPQIFFRLGYTNQETKHSPRLKAEEVIKNDF